jgi:hypothetical protein
MKEEPSADQRKDAEDELYRAALTQPLQGDCSERRRIVVALRGHQRPAGRAISGPREHITSAAAAALQVI